MPQARATTVRNTGDLDDPREPRHVRFDQRAERLGRAADRFIALRCACDPRRLATWIALATSRASAIDDRCAVSWPVRTHRTSSTIPGPSTPDSAIVGTLGSARARLRPVRPSARTLAGLRQRLAGRGRDECHLHVAGDQRRVERRVAAERHVHDVDAGGMLHDLHGEVQRRADAARAVVQAAGLGLGERNQFLRCRRRKLRRDDEQQGRGGYLRHRGEIFHRIERQRFVERGSCREPAHRRAASCSHREPPWRPHPRRACRRRRVDGRPRRSD